MLNLIGKEVLHFLIHPPPEERTMDGFIISRNMASLISGNDLALSELVLIAWQLYGRVRWAKSLLLIKLEFKLLSQRIHNLKDS